MSSTKGSIHFEITADNDDLKRKLAESRQAILNSGKSAEAEGAKIEGMFKRAALAAGGFFTVQQALSFGQSIVRVRGEMQMMEKSFEVLLQSKSKAMQMIAEIKQLAIDSPLEMPQVSGAVQTLLGFGVSAEKVMGIVGQLSDVSMGNADRFQSLALVYAQTQAAGKLMGQDLLQMINAGFNPLQVISEQTGKSIAQLKDDMSAGAISAEMVADAFATVTSEGGKFYQMTQKQAEGIVGLQASLEDAITNQMNKFGEKNEELIADGLRFATSVVENADAIGKTLATLVVAYGSYKGAIIATNAVQNVITNTQYSVEIEELSKLLPLKQASANADIQQTLASGGVTQAKAEQLMAIRAEAQAELEHLRVKQRVLATQMAEASKEDALALKQALNAERKERAAREELSSATLSGNAQKIRRAEIKLTCTEEELNIALKNRSVAADKLSVIQSKANSVATAAETLQQGINTAGTVAATRAKNIFTAATVRLSTAMKSMKAAFASNPFGLLLTVITTIMTATSLFNKQLDGTSGQFGEFAIKIKEEEGTFKDLKKAILQTTEGTQERADIIKLINSRYPGYLDSMLTEKSRTEDIISALTTANEKMLENIKMKLKASQLEGILSKQLQTDAGFIEKQVATFSNADKSPEQVALFTKEMATLVEKARQGKATVDDARAVLIAQGEDEKWINNAIISSDSAASKKLREITSGFHAIRKAAQEAENSEQVLGALLKSTGVIEPEPKLKKEPKLKEEPSEKPKDYTEERIKAERELKDMRISVAFETEQAVIDSKEQGFEKEMAQIDLNYRKKQTAIELWEREQRKIVIDAQKAKFLAEGGTEENFKVDTNDTAFSLINKGYDAKTKSNNTESANLTKEAYKAELDQYAEFAVSYIDKVNEFEDNLKNLDAKHKQERADLINSGASKETINQFDQKAKQEVDTVTAVQKELLAGLDEQMEVKSQTFILFAEQIADMGIQELKLKLDEAEQLLAQTQTAAGAGGDQTSVIEYQAQIRVLKQQIVALTKKSDKNEDATSGDALKGYKATLKAVNELGNAAKDIAGAFEGLDGDIFSVMDSISTMSSSVGSMLGTIASMSAASQVTIATTTVAANTGIVVTSTVATTAIQGVEKASVILAIIGAAMQIATAIAKAISGLFNDDKKTEKEIRKTQVEVDKLDKAYRKLEKSIEDAYSSDAAQLIEQGNVLLEQQNKQLEKQKELENSKKKPDTQALDEYNEKIEKNNEEIEENSKKAQEAIFGTDVKSAIDDFASAYMEAWASGEDRAKSQKDVVKNMIRGVINEMVKSNIGKTIGDIRAKIEAAMEGGISAQEEDEIDALVQQAYKENETYTKPFEKWLVDQEDTPERESAARGIATASQESVDENNGRLTTMQEHTNSLNENIKLMTPNVASIKESIDFIRDNAADQLVALYAIRDNTAPIATICTEIMAMKNDINTMMVKGVKMI